MNTCPTCQPTSYQVKDGFTGGGSQRMRWLPVARLPGYGQASRTQALKMYVDRLNFRRVARLLGLHHHTVINWINAIADHRSAAPPVPPHVETVEMGELSTFVTTKKRSLYRDLA